MASLKARYWSAILYPENMISNWEDEISFRLQVPYCYIIHNKDVDMNNDDRKTHIHLLLAFSNTTTQKASMTLVQKLSFLNRSCCSTIEPVNNIRFMYNYLIHDTEDCRKKHKHLYFASDRISGNGFDIGNYEQVSQADKDKMLQELCQCIVDKQFTNFVDAYKYMISNYDSSYFEVIRSYNGFLERLCKGNYLRFRAIQEAQQKIQCNI